MCDGGVFSVPIAMAIVGAGTAVYQGKQQAKALQEQMNQEQEVINKEASVATNEKLSEVRALRASARAAAAESAIGGNSLFGIQQEIEAQGGRDMAQIESNRKQGIHASTADTKARAKVAKAETLSSVTSYAAQGASGAYNNYKITS
jgi:hypothetical protein